MVSPIVLQVRQERVAAEAAFAHMFDVTKRFGDTSAVEARTSGVQPEYVKPLEVHGLVVSKVFLKTLVGCLDSVGVNVNEHVNDHFAYYDDNLKFLVKLKSEVEAQLESDMVVYRKLMKAFTVTYNGLYSAILGKKGDKAIDAAMVLYDAAEAALVVPEQNLMRSRLAEEYMRYAPVAYKACTVEEFVVAFTRILKTDLWNPNANNNYADLLNFVYNDLFVVQEQL